MKRLRPSYRGAVRWIALNEETCIDDVEEMADDVCVQLTADAWGKRPATAALDVIRFRRKAFGTGGQYATGRE